MIQSTSRSSNERGLEEDVINVNYKDVERGIFSYPEKPADERQ